MTYSAPVEAALPWSSRAGKPSLFLSHPACLHKNLDAVFSGNFATRQVTSLFLASPSLLAAPGPIINHTTTLVYHTCKSENRFERIAKVRSTILLQYIAFVLRIRYCIRYPADNFMFKVFMLMFSWILFNQRKFSLKINWIFNHSILKIMFFFTTIWERVLGKHS